jgi:hypothetical protein
MSPSFICLVSLFFLPCCSSNSCPPLPQPSKLPCNESIEIKKPFFLTNDTNQFCENAINIKCGHSDNISRVYLFHLKNIYFNLENILYAPDLNSQNKLIVSDPLLEQNLNSSFCANLQFSVLNQSHKPFDYDQFTTLSGNIQSFCRSQNLSSHNPISSKEYTLNYSARTDEYLPKYCYRKHANASFEWKFAFNDVASVILLSAQYSYNLLPQQGCFNQSIIGENSNG